MKTIVIQLILSFMPLFIFAQKGPVQKPPAFNALAIAEPSDWLDTSNMYKSRYGPVARLTQDNMPCIMGYTPVKPIPNSGSKMEAPNDIPNFWKKQPRSFPGRPDKAIPIPQKLNGQINYTSPQVGKKEVAK